MPPARTGLDSAIRTLRMAKFFKGKLDRGETLTSTVLAIEFEVSEKTARRFMSVYRQELDDNFIWDDSAKTFRRP